MKALAWDDEYNPKIRQDYLSRLCVELERNYKVSVSLESDPGKFLERAQAEVFDFYITDWFERRAVGEKQEARGAMLVATLRRLSPWKPIFVVSKLPKRIDGQLLKLARPVFLRSKDNPVAWLAFDICETLRDLGLLVDRRKVFIIYGHDRTCDGTRQQVERWLRQRGVSPWLLEAKRTQTGMLPDLMQEMNTCGAFIALCTPDDYCESGRDRNVTRWQPRENVLFEMGIVCGFARGAYRLTVVQKWTEGVPDQCSVLPSDWGGYLSLRFSGDVAAVFEALEHRLREIGVDLSGPPLP